MKVLLKETAIIEIYLVPDIMCNDKRYFKVLDILCILIQRAVSKIFPKSLKGNSVTSMV